MTMTNSRLLLELHNACKDVNRTIINPRIKELKLSDLSPLIKMVASARAAYLEEMFNLANSLDGRLPTTDQLKHLRYLRLTFEELSSGSKALETAIERGYLDIEGA